MLQSFRGDWSVLCVCLTSAHVTHSSLSALFYVFLQTLIYFCQRRDYWKKYCKYFADIKPMIALFPLIKQQTFIASGSVSFDLIIKRNNKNAICSAFVIPTPSFPFSFLPRTSPHTPQHTFPLDPPYASTIDEEMHFLGSRGVRNVLFNLITPQEGGCREEKMEARNKAEKDIWFLIFQQQYHNPSIFLASWIQETFKK